jgi:hypothetical protein
VTEDFRSRAYWFALGILFAVSAYEAACWFDRHIIFVR